MNLKEIHQLIGQVYDDLVTDAGTRPEDILFKVIDPEGVARDIAGLNVHYVAGIGWTVQVQLVKEGDESAARCSCVHAKHLSSVTAAHRYLAVPAGTHTARFVGPICDECATQCVAALLNSEDGQTRTIDLRKGE